MHTQLHPIWFQCRQEEVLEFDLIPELASSQKRLYQSQICQSQLYNKDSNYKLNFVTANYIRIQILMTNFNFFEGTFGFAHISQVQNSITFNPTLFQAHNASYFKQSLQNLSKTQTNESQIKQNKFTFQLKDEKIQKIKETNGNDKKKNILKIKRRNKHIEKGLQLSLIDMIKKARGL